MPHTWMVLIGDLKNSRGIAPRDRRIVDLSLKRVLALSVRRFEPHFRLRPQLMKGDEVQAVLRAEAPVLAILTHLRAQLALAAERGATLRAGIGRGTIQHLSRRGPFESDGQAFHRAREALEDAARGVSLTGWVTGDPSVDRLASVVLALTDAIMSRWTGPQWEAVTERLEGKGLHEIAREKRVSFQSVSKRLRSANWAEVRFALDFLDASAADLPRSPGE